MDAPAVLRRGGAARAGHGFVTAPDANAVIDFLVKFFGADVPVNLCHKSADGFVGRTFDGLRGKRGDVVRQVIEEWGGVDCYFSIGVPRDVTKHRKLLKDDIFSCGWVWTDIDPKKGRTTEQCIEAAKSLKPRLLIRSGTGAWAFIKLAGDVPGKHREEIELRNKALALGVGGDHCHDICRVARLPGTVNSKNDTLATCEWFDDAPDLSLDQLPKAADDLPPPRHDAPGDVHEQLRDLDWDDLDTSLTPTQVKVLSEDSINVAVFGARDRVTPEDRSPILLAFAMHALRDGATLRETASIMANRELIVSSHLWNTHKRSGGKCMSQSQALKQIKKCLTKALQNIHGRKVVRDAIDVNDGELADIVTKVEDAILAGGLDIYQRSGLLVRTVAVTLPGEQPDGISRPAGAIVLHEVAAAWLRERVSKLTRFVAINEKGEARFMDPPMEYITTYLARVGEWRVRHLAGVVTAPTLRADGSVLQEPGYDATSQLLLATGGAAFPRVPELPTREEALAALDALEAPFAKFPYVSEAARCVPIAAILTGLVRHRMRTAPLFVFEAPKAGTGKSLLAESVGVLVSGREPPATPQGDSPEEDQKSLVSALMAGDPILLLDNVDKSIEGAFLCMLLTQQSVAPRLLGRNEKPTFSTRLLMLATGNNVQISGDMTRRVIVCRMDARMEQPDTRQFDGDLKQELLERRPALVAAGLTVLRAYISAGRPAPLPKIGSFDDFNLIREALVWLGRADPAETRRSVLIDDAKSSSLRSLLTIWRQCLGDRDVRVGELVEFIHEDARDPRRARLLQLLLEMTRRPVLSELAVAKALGRELDVVVGGLALVRREDVRLGHRWRVAQLGEGVQGELLAQGDAA